MKYIQIKKSDNGFHQNINSNFEMNPIPEGWAIIPEEMVTTNFPYGDIETATISKKVTVTKWTPLPVPAEPYVETEEDELVEMIADHEERLCLLELGITE